MQIKLPRFHPDKVARKIFTKDSYGSRGEIKLELIEFAQKNNLILKRTYIAFSPLFKGMEEHFTNGRISGHHIWKIIKGHFKVKYA